MNGNDADLTSGDLTTVTSHDGEHRQTTLRDGYHQTSAGA
jgi:hypothetical protein